MKINILGTPYTVTVKKYDEDETFKRDSIAGWCSGGQKEIVLCDMTTYRGWEHETREVCQIEQRRILRHEIVHGFLTESGLSSNSNPVDDAWARNEEMVDWIAIQGPKLYKAWKEAGAI